MPYMLTHIAPTSRQPCQLDRKMRYDTATLTEMDKVMNGSRKSSAMCWPEDASCPIEFKPDSSPPRIKEAATTRHTASTLKAITRAFLTLIASLHRATFLVIDSSILHP